MRKKKNTWIVLPIGIILIGILFLLYSFIDPFNRDNNVSDPQDLIIDDKKTIDEGKESHDKTDLNKDREESVDEGFRKNVGGGAGGAGGVSSDGGNGGSSGGTGSGEEGGCSKERISYALKDFSTKTECLDYNGDICLEKNVTCEVVLQNLDKDDIGIFDIKTTILDSSNYSILDFSEDSINVSSNDLEMLTNYFMLYGDDSEGDANKIVNCLFNAIEPPYKIICS